MGVHYLMSNARPPFSDWLAQTERWAERTSRRHGVIRIDSRFKPAFQSYYDAGLSPQEAAADLLGD